MAVGGRIIVPVELRTNTVAAALRQTVVGAMSAASLAVGAGLAGFVALTVKAGLEYDAALNEMQAVSHATAAQMAAVDQEAKALGADASIAGASATDAARAMTELAKGGFSVEDSMTAARGSLQLAAAAGIDAAAAANIQVKMLQTFALGAEEATHVADILASTANATSLEIGDVAAAMQQFGAVAHLFGIDAGDAAVAIAALAEAGIAGSDAGTSLKTMLTQLANPSEKAAGALKLLGVQAYDQSGTFVGLETIMKQLALAQQTLTAEQFQGAAATAFGTDAIRAASALAAQGADGYNRLAAATDQQGAAAALAAAKNQGLVGLVSQVQNNLENLFLETYQQLKPTLETLTTFGLTVLSIVGPVVKFGAAIAGNAVVVRTLAIAGGIFFAVWAASKFVLLANGVRIWVVSMITGTVAAGGLNGVLAIMAARLGATAAGQTILAAAVLLTRGYFLVATAAGTLLGGALRALIVAGTGSSVAMSLLTGAVALTTGAVRALWLAVAANPLLALAALLAAAVVGFAGYAVATGKADGVTDSLKSKVGDLLGSLKDLATFDFESLGDRLAKLNNDPGGLQASISDQVKTAKDALDGLDVNLGGLTGSVVDPRVKVQAVRDAQEIRNAFSDIDWSGGAAAAVPKLADVQDQLQRTISSVQQLDGVGDDQTAKINGYYYSVSELATALEQTGHAGDYSNAALADATGLLDANFKRVQDLTAAAADAAQEQTNLTTALNGTGAVLGLTAGQVSEYALLMGYTAARIATGAVSSTELTDAVAHVRDMLANAGPKMTAWQKAVQDYGESAQTATDKSNLLRAAIDALTGKDLDLVSAQANASDAIYGLKGAFDQAREAADAHGQSLFLASGALDTQAAGAKTVVDALTGVRDSSLDVAAATYTANLATMSQADAAKAAAQVFRDNLDNALRAHQAELGLTDAQVNGLIQQYGNLPDDVVTQAILQDLASTGIAGVTNQLAGLNGQSASVSATANVGPAIAALDELGRRIYSINNTPVYVQTSGGRAAFAAGGFLPAVQTFAAGGVREQHVAQIAHAARGMVRVWAEDETGGESYVPHARDWRRAGAHQIMRHTAAVLGGLYYDEEEVRRRQRDTVARFAGGGVTVNRSLPAAVTSTSGAASTVGGGLGSIDTLELHIDGEVIDVRVDRAVVRSLDGEARELDLGRRG